MGSAAPPVVAGGDEGGDDRCQAPPVSSTRVARKRAKSCMAPSRSSLRIKTYLLDEGLNLEYSWFRR